MGNFTTNVNAISAWDQNTPQKLPLMRGTVPPNDNAKFARIPVMESMFVCTKFPLHPHEILEMYSQSIPLNQVGLMNSVDF